MDSYRYKIRIPNADVFEKMQRKAFQLNHRWSRPDKFRIMPYRNAFAMFLYPDYYSDNDGRLTTTESEYWFNNHSHPEISWEDFLKIGEPVEEKEDPLEEVEFPIVYADPEPMIGIKMKCNDQFVLKDIAIKCGKLKIRNDVWGYTPTMISLKFSDWTLRRNTTEAGFQRNPCTEVTVEQFLSCATKEEIQNLNTQNEMEIILICSKEPKKAKNLTIGNEYTGILIDSEGTQVDTVREAKYFLCNNNAGNEARYSIELFDEPNARQPRRRNNAGAQAAQVPPPPPPPPPLPDFESYGESIFFFIQDRNVNIQDFVDNNTKTIAKRTTNGGVWNFTIQVCTPRMNEVIELLGDQTSIIQLGGTQISCGVGQIYNISSAIPRLVNLIQRLAGIYADNGINVTEEQKTNLLNSMFANFVKGASANASYRFCVASCHDSTTNVVPVMESFCSTTIQGHNNNSGHNIYVWTIERS